MEKITRKEAKEQGLKHYFTGKPCKHGHIEERLTSSGHCAPCLKKRLTLWVKENPERAKQIRKKYAEQNKDKTAKRAQRYKKNNKGKVNSRNAVRRAVKLQRTPQWLDSEEKWLIEEIYELASLRTKITGLSWHVDHIIPMQGTNVSGLHVPENLQVILGRENVSKNNKWNWDTQQ